MVRGHKHMGAGDRGFKRWLIKELLPRRWLVVSWYQNFYPAVLEHGNDAVIVEIARRSLGWREHLNRNAAIDLGQIDAVLRFYGVVIPAADF